MKANITALWGGLWAMAPKQLEQFAHAVHSIDSTDPVAGSMVESGFGEVLYEVADGRAYIPITGVIMKSVPAAIRWLGMPATSTLEASAAIEAAERDHDVKEIVFVIDSPGGTVAGVQALSDQIKHTTKPTAAAISDMAASAAYWLASQTDHIEANATAQVGSIGVYSVMVDSSQAYEDAGIRVHVVRSGSHKGSGVEGSPITPEDISEEQRMIDQLSHMFAATVARGRGLTPAQVAELATGQVWLAADALKLGLIDSIYGLAMAETETKVKAMEEEEKAPEEQPAEEEQSEHEELKARVDELEQRVAELEAKKEELEGEVEEESAKAQAALAALGEVKATRKGELMAKAISDGKVTPAMMPAVEAFAEACGDNVESLAGFIENLPVQTREQAQTQHPAGDARGQVSASDAQICKALGLSQESFVNNSKWDSIGFDGKPSTKGGLH